MIQDGEREVYSILYSFDGREGLSPWMERFAELLRQYCGVTDLEQWTV